MQRSYVCANVGNVRGYRRYVDMYTSAYQHHSPTVGLHAEGLALQCLSLCRLHCQCLTPSAAASYRVMQKERVQPTLHLKIIETIR